MSNPTVRSWTERHHGRGLSLHVNRYATRGDGGPHATILLLHGFVDVGASFTNVALDLACRGHEVVAPDLRGFGKSDWGSRDGYYHFPNYLADIDALVRALAPQNLIVVGHSMGGTIATMFCGARPDAALGLVLLEGLGPPAMAADMAVVRARRWLDQIEKPAPPRLLSNEEDALRRLQLHHPRVDSRELHKRVKVLVRRVDDKLFWAHDPLHRTTAPVPFQVEHFKAFVAAIRCRVLLVSGGDRGWSPPDEAQRIAAFASPPEHIELPDAGHMMHWTSPSAVAEAIANFADSTLQ